MAANTAKGRAASPGRPEEKKEDAKKEDTPKIAAKSGGLFTPKNAIIGVVVVAVLFGLKTYLGGKVDFVELLEKGITWVEKQGQAAVYWYLAFTLIGVVCLIPTTPMEIAGGFLFSPTYGMWTVLALTGFVKIIANTISVLVARWVLKEWVLKNVVAKSELLTMVSTAVKEEPWKMAFLVRGSMVPLFVKNYGLGVMEIDLLPIAGCSVIFTNFYAFQNIYMGSAMENLKDVFAPKKAAGPGDWFSTGKKMMPLAFNVVLIVFLVMAVKGQIKKQKAAIEEKLKKEQSKKAS